MTQDKFELWLSQRHFEEGDAALANKIARAAREVPQKKAGWSWLQWMPQPAYAFASVALLAVVLVMGQPASRQGNVTASDDELASISNGELMAEMLFYSDDETFF